MKESESSDFQDNIWVIFLALILNNRSEYALKTLEPVYFESSNEHDIWESSDNSHSP